ncbi:glutathione S-transferase [Klebsiella pneumoniae]|uniref:glutathione S-transferase n=1 Tax=Klebsiella pneumoniae TaxID=573 RepID=UPI00192DE5BF|nr:glutathione S-transferase [Klebsiella pneumoniae]
MSHDRATLYGLPGWGSTLAEIMLVAASTPFDFVAVEGFDAPGPNRNRILALNPLGQIPVLVLADGQVMTESAAIALHLAETHPGAGLAPAPGDPARARFLRLLVWIVANIYPTFTYGDYPERWARCGSARRPYRCLSHPPVGMAGGGGHRPLGAGDHAQRARSVRRGDGALAPAPRGANGQRGASERSGRLLG